MAPVGGVLAWVLLIAGSLASLGANVAVAERPTIARIIAAWPSFALIDAYEMLMGQMRQSRRGRTVVEAVTSDGQSAAEAAEEPAGDHPGREIEC